MDMGAEEALRRPRSGDLFDPLAVRARPPTVGLRQGQTTDRRNGSRRGEGSLAALRVRGQAAVGRRDGGDGATGQLVHAS